MNHRANEYIRKMATAEKSDIVEFKFKSQGGKVVRCLKSFLSSKSPVFATQFNDTWNVDTVYIDDPVNFNQYKQFQKFIEVLIGLEPITWNTVYDVAELYFYADKYQVEDLKAKLITVLPKLPTTAYASDLQSGILFSKMHNFDTMLSAIDRVQIGLKPNNYVRFFCICSVYKMEKLMDKIVDYAMSLDHDNSWPPELIRRVAERIPRRTLRKALNLN